MKTILITLATIAVSLVALPQKVEARPHCGSSHSSYTYRSGSASCGCPVYTKRVFAGYDCYNRPTYRYYRVPMVHRCRSHHSNYHYRSNRGYRHSKYYHNRRYSSHRRHSGISLPTPFGNVRICR
ncbi:MAG: hypothetical protein KJO79_01600 [Verrucomicrobiae bacterium]|nr:hypothetical protein [Verrucomicrobiae bacterium]NNJ85842.1 hypothetical protein [Akkermansiaceae bacterium]